MKQIFRKQIGKNDEHIFAYILFLKIKKFVKLL